MNVIENTNVDLVYEAVNQMRKIMGFENNGTSSRLLDFMKFCANATSGLNRTSGHAVPFHWLNITNSEECNEQIFKNYTGHTTGLPDEYVEDYQEFFRIVEYFVEDSDACFLLMKEAKEVLNTYLQVSRLIENLSITDEPLFYYKLFQVRTPSEDFDTRLKQMCIISRENISDIVRYLANGVKEDFGKLIDATSEIRYIFRNTLYMFSSYIWSLRDTMDEYLTKTITKQELGMRWFSECTLFDREEFLQDIKRIEDNIHEYERSVRLIVDLLLGMYDSGWSLNIIDESIIPRLQLMKMAATGDSLTDFVREGDLFGLIDHINEIANQLLDHLKTNILKLVSDIPRKIQEFEMNLREYQDSIIMDSQFYL